MQLRRANNAGTMAKEHRNIERHEFKFSRVVGVIRNLARPSIILRRFRFGVFSGASERKGRGPYWMSLDSLFRLILIRGIFIKSHESKIQSHHTLQNPSTTPPASGYSAFLSQLKRNLIKMSVQS